MKQYFSTVLKLKGNDYDEQGNMALVFACEVKLHRDGTRSARKDNLKQLASAKLHLLGDFDHGEVIITKIESKRNQAKQYKQAIANASKDIIERINKKLDKMTEFHIDEPRNIFVDEIETLKDIDRGRRWP